MLNFAADLGIEDGDVAEYMWLCEEALSASVLGEWKAHADEEGSVYYHNGSTNSRRPPSPPHPPTAHNHCRWAVFPKRAGL